MSESTQIDDILDEEIKSLPAIYYKLREISLDEDSTFEQVAEIVSMDTGISARLLKIVNSAFYGFSNKIETIHNALAIIGIDALNELILSTSVISKFRGIPPEVLSMDSFWRHSVSCAMIATQIAAQIKNKNSGQLYLAGLLHDIGELVLCTRAPKLITSAVTRAREHKENLYQAECKIMGFDHTDLGSALLKSWKLPERLVDAVAFHHNPSYSKTYSEEASIIHMADHLSYQWELGTSGEPFIPPLDEKAKNKLALTDDFLAELQEKIHEQVDEAVAGFLS